MRLKNMKTQLCHLKPLAFGILMLASISTVNAANVAFGKTVAVNNGKFFSDPNGLITDYRSITDGVYLPYGQIANAGTVWWIENADSIQNAVTVFLGEKPCTITSLTLQVDNNDDYKISWVDSRSNLNFEVTAIPNRSPIGGMVKTTVHLNAYTKAFKIRHDEQGAGDNYYAISEFAANGVCK